MKKQLLILVWMIAALGTANAQERRTADGYFSGSRYKDALPLYEKLYTKTKSNNKEEKATLSYQIGECYRLMNRTDEALAWYDSTLHYGNREPKLNLHYGESLLREGRYAEAETYLQQYVSANPGDSYGKDCLASSIYGRERTGGNPYINVTPLSQINTPGYEYGIGEYDGRLTYAYGAAGNRSVSSRTAVAYSELLSVNLSDTGLLSKDVMNGLHKNGCSECCTAYDPVMDVVYITRTSPNSKPQTQIVAYQYNAGKKKWEAPAKEKRDKLFSLPGKVTGHPFITPDGGRMYFAAILEGGYGGSDIWFVERETNGTWGAPVNAGATVNTAGDEIFPSVYDDVLYFASTGHVGFGGYDMYASIIEGRTFEQAWNLGQPYNSHRDDMDLLIGDKLQGAFFVSDRGESTFDDIYTVTPARPFNLEIKGVVLDRATNLPIMDATVMVEIPDEANHTKGSDQKGNFIINVVPEKNTTLTATKQGYMPSEQKTLPPFPDRFGLLDLTDPAQNTDAVLFLSKIQPHGIIRDASTLEPLAGIKVVIMENGVPVAELLTNEHGEYSLEKIGENIKQITVSHKNYITANKELAPETLNNEMQTNSDSYVPVLNFYLNPMPIAGLLHVYYGFDHPNVCPESLADLDKVIEYLKTHADTRIAIASHTDSRGSDPYNQALSARRAYYVVNYLKSKGISANRITWKGFGERELYIPDAITEEQHWLNRRSEFAVIDLSGKTIIHSNPLSENDFSRFCGGIGMKGGIPDSLVKENKTGNYIIQVLVLAPGVTLKQDYRENVENISGKILQKHTEPNGLVKYYIGPYNSVKEAGETAGNLKNEGIDVFIRLGY